VAQIWAGPTWGAFFWPRVGHEVVVAFAEGDPDQPLVVGSVYNASNMPPVDLPEQKTIAGIKSKIFDGDPASKFNAIYIHDAPGTEYIQVHCEAHEVRNCETNGFNYVPQAEFSFHGHFLP
jgi:type VI secretion system secreted protein VgrG